MIPISKVERKTIERRFPKSEIVATRHHAFLIGREADEPVRFPYSLRNMKSPPTRREKERLQKQYQHMFSDRSRYNQNRK